MTSKTQKKYNLLGILRSISSKVYFCCLLFCVGCGYQLKNSGTILPPTVQKIYIPYVQNLSSIPSLTQLVTESLRDEFDRYGAITVVETSQEADATLAIKIVDLKRRTRTTTGKSDIDNQRNSTLRIAGDLKTNEGKVLWSVADLSITKGFGISSSTVVSSSVDFLGSGLGSQDIAGLGERELLRNQEQTALQEISDEAARKIYEQAVAEDF